MGPPPRPRPFPSHPDHVMEVRGEILLTGLTLRRSTFTVVDSAPCINSSPSWLKILPPTRVPQPTPFSVSSKMPRQFQESAWLKPVSLPSITAMMLKGQWVARVARVEPVKRVVWVGLPPPKWVASRSFDRGDLYTRAG